MTHERFIELAKEKVRDYENERVDINFMNVQLEDIFIVWSCKTLQNSKALLSAKHVIELLWRALSFIERIRGKNKKAYEKAWISV